MRLEREREGYHSVEFGGPNPPYVESLWRRDRIRFWSVVPPAAIALFGLAWYAATLPIALVAAILWAPIVGFFVAGLRSYASTRLGGVGWWVGAGAATLASVLAAWM